MKLYAFSFYWRVSLCRHFSSLHYFHVWYGLGFIFMTFLAPPGLLQSLYERHDYTADAKRPLMDMLSRLTVNFIKERFDNITLLQRAEALKDAHSAPPWYRRMTRRLYEWDYSMIDACRSAAVTISAAYGWKIFHSDDAVAWLMDDWRWL